MEFVKLKKRPKSVHGCQRYTPKCKAVAVCAWKSARHPRGGRLPRAETMRKTRAALDASYIFLNILSFMVFIEPEHTDTVKKWYNSNKFSCFPLYNMSGCRLLISIRMNEISLHEASLHLRMWKKLIKIIRLQYRCASSKNEISLQEALLYLCKGEEFISLIYGRGMQMV